MKPLSTASTFLSISESLVSISVSGKTAGNPQRVTTSCKEMIRSKCFYPPPFFNLEIAVGNSNNCRLAVEGFLLGKRLWRKSFQAVPLQMLCFLKARSLCFIVFAAPVFSPFLLLFWGTICELGPGFICRCSSKGKRGCQMKPINHLTGYKR